MSDRNSHHDHAVESLTDSIVHLNIGENNLPDDGRDDDKSAEDAGIEDDEESHNSGNVLFQTFDQEHGNIRHRNEEEAEIHNEHEQAGEDQLHAKLRNAEDPSEAAQHGYEAAQQEFESARERFEIAQEALAAAQLQRETALDVLSTVSDAYAAARGS